MDTPYAPASAPGHPEAYPALAHFCPKGPESDDGIPLRTGTVTVLSDTIWEADVETCHRRYRVRQADDTIVTAWWDEINFTFVPASAG